LFQSFGETVEEDGRKVVELGQELVDGLNLHGFEPFVDFNQASGKVLLAGNGASKGTVAVVDLSLLGHVQERPVSEGGFDDGQQRATQNLLN